jgi:hypothetical protein
MEGTMKIKDYLVFAVMLIPTGLCCCARRP